MAGYELHIKAAKIVRDAGGRLVGRTRLQKAAYLFQLAGFAQDFAFEYRHYGPYSEELAEAMEIAIGLKLVREEEKQTEWGGWYSIYNYDVTSHADKAVDCERTRFLAAAASTSAIELELAATAAFLYSKEGIGRDGNGDPWTETKLRKPEKSRDGRLERAKRAYRELQRLASPIQLPPIA